MKGQSRKGSRLLIMQYALPVRELLALLLLCYVVIQETLRGSGGNILSVGKRMLRLR